MTDLGVRFPHSLSSKSNCSQSSNSYEIARQQERLYEEQLLLQTELRHQIARQRLPFGKRIRNVRSAFGWSQKTLARVLGVSKRTIIRHEATVSHRPKPRIETLVKVRGLEEAYPLEITVRMKMLGQWDQNVTLPHTSIALCRLLSRTRRLWPQY
jgi:DNA-binding XRE family transcriptional regulator